MVEHLELTRSIFYQRWLFFSSDKKSSLLGCAIKRPIASLREDTFQFIPFSLHPPSHGPLLLPSLSLSLFYTHTPHTLLLSRNTNLLTSLASFSNTSFTHTHYLCNCIHTLSYTHTHSHRDTKKTNTLSFELFRSPILHRPTIKDILKFRWVKKCRSK